MHKSALLALFAGEIVSAIETVDHNRSDAYDETCATSPALEDMGVEVCPGSPPFFGEPEEVAAKPVRKPARPQ